jgi:hypothetical protein
VDQQVARIMTRLPLEIRDFLAEDAKRNRRSMNSHLIAILEERKREIEKKQGHEHMA